MGCSDSRIKEEPETKITSKTSLPVLSKNFEMFNSEVYKNIKKEEKEEREKFEEYEEEAVLEPLVIWENLNMDCETYYSLVNDLSKNPHLLEFTMDNFEVEGNCDIFINLARALIKMTSITRLEFSNVFNTGNKVIKSVAKIFESNKLVESLVIRNLKLQERDGKYLKLILAELAGNLCYFEISEIAIDLLFSQVLAGIQANDTIAELVLCKLNMCERDFTNLIELIQIKSNIVSLNLSENPIKEGVNIFLRLNIVHLETLRLNECQIDDELFDILLEGLKENKSLKELEVKENKITEISVNYLKKFFDINSCLKVLNLSENLIMKEQMYDILSGESMNKIICDFTPKDR